MSTETTHPKQADRGVRTTRQIGRMLAVVAAGLLAAATAAPAIADYRIDDFPPTPVSEIAVQPRPALEWEPFVVENPEGARPMQSR